MHSHLLIFVFEIVLMLNNTQSTNGLRTQDTAHTLFYCLKINVQVSFYGSFPSCMISTFSLAVRPNVALAGSLPVKQMTTYWYGTLGLTAKLNVDTISTFSLAVRPNVALAGSLLVKQMTTYWYGTLGLQGSR